MIRTKRSHHSTYRKSNQSRSWCRKLTQLIFSLLMISRKWIFQLIFWWCIYWISILPFLTKAQNTVNPITLPPLTNLVTDYSAVLDSTVLSWLNNEAFAIQQQTSAEIASVLFPNRNWNELFDIGMRLFRESGVWSAEKNNGLLLLIATEEKKLRIIVGYWLEWLFPDIWIRDLIETKIRPLVNEWQRKQCSVAALATPRAYSSCPIWKASAARPRSDRKLSRL